ncbi:Pkinase-domain-containing protein [Coprinellus micaceus]|uniref:Pkinase-domain-containing protein n=1 Tax=Coprinellus micaceus TaxID=71717 RepID=A0A4Y7SIP1_COPMI|nr:Pkinase-domain-containing protein [Coprinellus micaceus]
MYEVIATESSIWIVTELCSGGELFDYLAEKGRLAEDETRILFGQLCLAVAYLHDNQIVHRDLKLENVLLDERCRVKLGDFGFTREYERGAYMETFCGTTGYASPEMLQGRKYQGPEVDVWSLGVILYCLLTGTLPFDDDDEYVMREKIIKDDFEDPAWLSLESRDLLQNILQKDVAKRYTIPQILAHPWFTAKELTYEPDSPILQLPGDAPESSENSTEDHGSPFSKGQNIESSAPTTPDEAISDPFDSTINTLHDNPSTTTIRRTSMSDIESLSSRLTKQPETVPEEDVPETKSVRSVRLRPISWSNSSGSKAPPATIRTPARTKRRSMSSVLSENVLGEFDKTPTPLPPSTSHLDFASLLTTPTPIIFSTPLERDLLTNLSNMGMETAQMVHSVLTDACDSAGALWWMLKKKAERKALEEGSYLPEQVASPLESDVPFERTFSTQAKDESASRPPSSKRKRIKTNASVQTDDPQYADAPRSAPVLAFVPPTPTFIRPATPPRPTSPSRSPLLSPTSSVVGVDLTSRSNPTTPGGSHKEKDSSKNRKGRAGSVSIMQRATTALEAAGLVRKKSAEAVREDRAAKEREKELAAAKDRGTSGEESRSSHSYSSGHGHSIGAAGPSKLTKSPPGKGQKDFTLPSTPPPSEQSHSVPSAAGQTNIGSPWVDVGGHHAGGPTTSGVAAITARGEIMPHSHSAPNLDTINATPTRASGSTAVGSNAKTAGTKIINRANILTSLRLWFNDDRKGKRKATAMPATPQSASYNGRSAVPGGAGSSAKRRNSASSATKFNRANVAGAGHRAKRPSMSSRRSSSVNSRRSSVASMHMPVLDSPSNALRAMGSHTPNSDRGEYVPSTSRPSSVHSFSMQTPTAMHKHRKSPSASSSGSLHLRAASPMLNRHHRRAGSGGSGAGGTRVVRQALGKSPHARSNSATSSLYSPPSSRPASYYEPSESEGTGTGGLSLSVGGHGGGGSRNASPFRSRKRSNGNGRPGTAFVAQKRSGPLASPGFGSGAIGKSSWKKAWGMEPPGWQHRSIQILPAVEVLAMAPAMGASNDPPTLRDVFSGRNSFGHNSAGDESDWVDEDEDIPAFAGGLGQMGVSSSGSGSSATGSGILGGQSGGGLFGGEPIVTLSPAPRGNSRSKKRNGGGNGGGGKANMGLGMMGGSAGGGRSKPGHSPAERHSPLPPEPSALASVAEGRTGRRQLPPTRTGPAAIQEEDEDEEEE